MSINCWLILRVDAAGMERARDLFGDGVDDSGVDLAHDRVVMLYDGHRYPEFATLPVEDQVAAIEAHLGDELLRLVRDPHGVCVHPEVGQSFEDETYAQIAADDDSLFIPCQADASAPPAPTDGDDATIVAIAAILAWTDDANRDPALARPVRDALLHARWADLKAAIAKIPQLKAHAACLPAGGPKAKPRAPLAVPRDLSAFVLAGSDLSHLTAGPGSRTMQRDYPSLRDDIFGDDFDDLFGRKIARAALGDPTKRVVTLQYRTAVAIGTARAVFRAAFAAGGYAVEEHQKQHSDVVALVGTRTDATIFVRFSRLSEQPAVVDLLALHPAEA